MLEHPRVQNFPDFNIKSAGLDTVKAGKSVAEYQDTHFFPTLY